MNKFTSNILRWIFIQYNKPLLKKKYFQGSFKAPSINNSVEIIRDKWHIPHIYAQNLNDLFFSQGFVHAQDRIWQMEMSRRIGMGRLSEAFGKLGLDTDILTRKLGFNRLANKDLEIISTNSLDKINSFASGVNYYLDNFPLPIEFKLTKIRPEPWRPIDSLAWARVMSWTLSHGWSGSLTRSKIVQKIGSEKAEELNIFYPKDNPVELPDGLEFNILSSEGIYEAATGPFLHKDMEGGGRGSNAWAISAEKSITGSPILCNDTHLSLQLPSIWYLNHLICPDYHNTGSILPGLPGVILGHNKYISWGITLSFLDIEDIFIEKLSNSKKNHYIFKNELKPLKIIEEKIKVKNLPTHIEYVKITHHGPIISSNIDEEFISLSSKALKPNRMIDGFLKINFSNNWNDFVIACQILNAPPLNIVYADKQNNIGIWVTGKVPIRKEGNGQLPIKGWTGQGEWISEIPPEHMPHLLNPKQGYIISCNNKIIDKYPYFLGNSFMNGYRAKRIQNIFQNKHKITIKDCMDLHMDLKSIPGEEIVEGLFKGFKTARPKSQKALEQLLNWNYQLNPNSTGAIVYQVLIYNILRNLVEPELGEDLTDKYMGKGEFPILLPTSELLGQTIPALIKMIQNPNSKWIKNTRELLNLIDNSLEKTCNWLESNLGFDPEDWTWGTIHKIQFRHGLAINSQLLSNIFNIGPYEIGGDTDTVCQTAYNPSKPYDATEWCPAIRLIINLRDFDESKVILPPGQSGVLGSKYYNNMVDPWLNGEYVPLLWNKKAVFKYKISNLILEPNSE